MTEEDVLKYEEEIEQRDTSKPRDKTKTELLFLSECVRRGLSE